MTAPEVLLPVPLGSVVAERYRVERIIGVGGMGIVMAATHLQLDRPVAIKFLQPHALASPEVVARFMREARSAVRIKSEHVARVLDVGAIESGVPYMVMERLDGSDLAALLRASGRISIETAVDYMLQTLEAVAEAHSLGIVHRDLKPANLFLVSGGRAEIVKVLDFGISKTTSTTGSAESEITESSAVFGTPVYMSPEQLNSARDVDARSDVWSLGIVLYELLTGQVPFRAETALQLCVAIMHHPTPALRKIRNDVPAGLEAVIKRCMEKDRTLRFSSAEELALALAEYASSRSRASIDGFRRDGAVLGPRRSDGAGATDTVNSETSPPARDENPASTTQSEWGGTALGVRGRPRRWLLAAGLVGVGLTLASVAGIRFMAQHDVPAAESRPAAEMGSALTPSSAAGHLTQTTAAGIATSPEQGQLAVAATAAAPAAAGASAPVLQPSHAPRKSPLEKGQRIGNVPVGTTTRIAPASSARASERRSVASEGWEDER